VARSIYNAVLRVCRGPDELLAIPVKLYAAVEPRPIAFRLVHASDRVPVRQRLVHRDTREEVPRTAIRRGLVLPEGMIELREEELAELTPAASRTIEILRLLDLDALDHRWFARPYYLGPGDETDPYFAFARALAEAGQQALVRWTMRKKRYRGALRSIDGYLAVISLRAADEIVASSALPERAWPSLAEAELAMARQLVDMLVGKHDDVGGELEQFRDRYAEGVLALAAAKSEGRTPSLPPQPERPAPEPTLLAALEASIHAVRERDVA
jgi:DNA end-binding protein Ku